MSSLLANHDQIIFRDPLPGARHSLRLIDKVDGNNVTGDTIPYGCIVVIDESIDFPSDNNPPVKIIESDTDVILGLSILEYLTEESRNVAGNVGYPPNSQFPVAKKGEFKVNSETANKYGDPVYVRIDAGVAGDKIGYSFRNDEVVDETILIPNAYWVTVNSANTVGAISVNF